jgi:hypothetical protein
MTHNEAMRASEVHPAPRYNESFTAPMSSARRDYEDPRSGQLQTSPDSTPTKEDHEAPMHASHHLTQTPNTPQTTYSQELTVPYSHSRTSSTQSQQWQGNEAVVWPGHDFERSPSPPKRTYNSLSELGSGTTSSSPLASGVGGTSSVRDESPSKKMRLMKQESVRSLLSSIPQYVPPPPSLISPLRSTR